MSHRIKSFLGFVLAVALTGCQQAEENAYVEPPPPVVSVSQPVVQDVLHYDDFTGTVAAFESVEIRPRVEGYLDKVYFQAGSDVKEGDLLYLIDPKPYEAKLAEAQATLALRIADSEFRKFDYQRIQQLNEKQAASQFEMAQKKAAYDAALAEIDAAKANVRQAELNLGYTTIRAPLSGEINRTLVDAGNLVGAGGNPTLLTTIVKIEPIYVYFTVNEQALLGYIRQGKDGTSQPDKRSGPPVYLGLMDETGWPHVGKIDSAENQLDASTGTIKVRAIFSNQDDELGPGLFARIRIPTKWQKNAILVPERAIGTDQRGKYLLVVNEKDVVESRPVKIGQQVEDWRVIEEGLKPGEWVVVNGLQKARDGMKVKPERVTTSAPAPATLPAVETTTTETQPAK